MSDNLSEVLGELTIAKGDPERELVLRHKRLAFAGVRGVTFRTPVDTGRARGNWQATNDAPANGILEKVDKLGFSTASQARSSISRIRPFSAWWYSNNLPYIDVLEEGLFKPPDPGPSQDPRPDRFNRVLVSGGFSVQAPRGMVGVTMRELIAGLEPGTFQVDWD